MKTNMGNADKVLRILVAIVIVFLFFTGVITGIMAIILLILAGVFIITSILSYCPLYGPLGINTCKKKE